MATAQQKAWSLALEKGRNGAARASSSPDSSQKENPNRTAGGLLKSSIKSGMLKAIQLLATSGIATFGLTWVVLFFYTLFLDLVTLLSFKGFLFFPDPGDVLVVLPEDMKAISSRLFIYPVGILVTAFYGILLVILIMLVSAFIDQAGAVAKMLGIET